MTRIPGQLGTITLLPAFFIIVGISLLVQVLTAGRHTLDGEEQTKLVGEIIRYGLVGLCILSLAFTMWRYRKGIPQKGTNRFLAIGAIGMWLVFSFGALFLVFYLS
jgi:uncharacterized BrkB/YihY/UPF0761 family membrane protein